MVARRRSEVIPLTVVDTDRFDGDRFVETRVAEYLDRAKEAGTATSVEVRELARQLAQCELRLELRHRELSAQGTVDADDRAFVSLSEAALKLRSVFLELVTPPKKREVLEFNPEKMTDEELDAVLAACGRWRRPAVLGPDERLEWTG